MTLPVLAVLVGIALMVGAGVSNRRAKQRTLDNLLALTPFPLSTNEDDAVEGLAFRAVELAGNVVERVDRDRSLRHALDRARIPLRPGEFVLIVGCSALGVVALALLTTQSWPVAALGGLATIAVAHLLVRQRIAKRRRAFEAQLPDALSLVASSLSAGHTFLRAIQMMCEESSPPLSEEFSLVVSETQLGSSLVDALERMCKRVEVRDMDMAVQAIRIQQTIGGRLADLLHTLADFIRARAEVRREVQVLTAEGRTSAYVLTGLVPFLFLAIQVLNPAYMAPLFHGWGLSVIVGSAASVLLGLFVILRMVKIEI